MDEERCASKKVKDDFFAKNTRNHKIGQGTPGGGPQVVFVEGSYVESFCVTNGLWAAGECNTCGVAP